MPKGYDLKINITYQQKNFNIISKTISDLKKGFDVYNNTLKDLNGTVKSFTSNIAKLATIAIPALSFRNLIDSALSFTKTLENTRLGLKSLIYTMNEFYDAQGKLITGMDKWKMAGDYAARVQQQLRIEGLKTVATYEQLARAFNQAYVPAIRAGFDEKQIVKFTTAVVNAASAMGISLDMLGEEVRSILSGTMQVRTTLLKPLMDAAGLTNEKIRELAKTGKLYEAVMKALQGAVYGANEAQYTWQGVISNTKDAIQNLLADGLSPLTDTLKKLGLRLQKMIYTVKDGKIIFNKDLLKAIKDASDSLAHLTEVIFDFSKKIIIFIDKNKELIKTLAEFYFFGKVASLIGKATLSIRAFIQAILKALNASKSFKTFWMGMIGSKLIEKFFNIDKLKQFKIVLTEIKIALAFINKEFYGLVYTIKSLSPSAFITKFIGKYFKFKKGEEYLKYHNKELEKLKELFNYYDKLIKNYIKELKKLTSPNYLEPIIKDAKAWADSFKNLEKELDAVNKKSKNHKNNVDDTSDSYKKWKKILDEMLEKARKWYEYAGTITDKTTGEKIDVYDIGKFDQFIKDTQAWADSFKNLKEEVTKAEFPEYFEKVEEKYKDLIKESEAFANSFKGLKEELIKAEFPEYFKETTDEIKNIWEHAFNNLQDIFSNWIRKLKVNFDSIVNLFKDTVSQMIGAWAAGMARMGMVSMFPNIFSGGQAGSGSTGGGIGIPSLTSFKSFLPGQLGESKLWNLLGAKTGIVDFTGKGGLLSAHTWTVIGNMAGGAFVGGFVGSLYQKLFGSGGYSNIGGSLGGAIGSFFGPVGTGIGSIIGSALGGLFGGKKKKPKIRLGAKEVELTYIPGQGFSIPGVQYFDDWYTKYAKSGLFYGMEQHVSKSTMQKVIEAEKQIIDNVLSGFGSIFNTLFSLVDENTKKYIENLLATKKINLNFDIAGSAKSVDELLQKFGENLSINLYNQYKDALNYLFDKGKENLISNYKEIFDVLDETTLSEVQELYKKLDINLKDITNVEDLEEVVKNIKEAGNSLGILNEYLSTVKTTLDSINKVVEDSKLSEEERIIRDINLKYEEQAKILENLGIEVNKTNLALANSIEIFAHAQSAYQSISQKWDSIFLPKTEQVKRYYQQQLNEIAIYGLEASKKLLEPILPGISDQDIINLYSQWKSGTLQVPAGYESYANQLFGYFKMYDDAVKKANDLIQYETRSIERTTTSASRSYSTVKSHISDLYKTLLDIFDDLKKRSEDLRREIEYSILKPSEKLKFSEQEYFNLRNILESTSLSYIKQHPDEFRSLYDKYLSVARDYIKYIEDVYKSSPTAIFKKKTIMSDLLNFENIFGKYIGILPHYAEGGIVDRPTLSIIGESGPEAVIPLRSGYVPVKLENKNSITREQADTIINLLERLVEKQRDVKVKAEVTLNGRQITSEIKRIERLSA